MRDLAAESFEAHLRQAWRPRAGSQVSRRTMTAALIDSRDFLAAKRRAEIEPLLPAGPKIAFAGGLDFNDHRSIWSALDRVHAKHADMVLLLHALLRLAVPIVPRIRSERAESGSSLRQRRSSAVQEIPLKKSAEGAIDLAADVEGLIPLTPARGPTWQACAGSGPWPRGGTHLGRRSVL